MLHITFELSNRNYNLSKHADFPSPGATSLHEIEKKKRLFASVFLTSHRQTTQNTQSVRIALVYRSANPVPTRSINAQPHCQIPTPEEILDELAPEVDEGWEEVVSWRIV